MRVRWCCSEYKETAGAGKVTLIGIRRAESARRAKRNEVEINNHKFSGDLDGLDEYRQEQKAKRARRKSKKQGVNITNADEEQTLGCIHGKESLLISPIIYWTERDVWEFLNDVVRVPHCSLYDECWHRIGCIGCPMSSQKQKMLENARYPHVKRGWIRAIKAILATPGFSSSSSSDRLTEEQENEIAENIYDWWISGKSYKRWYAEKFQQMKFDFGEE